MSNVLIVPERNEGRRPLLVIEEGLKADSVDEVLVVDGWSTDDTVALLSERLPGLEEKYGKRVQLIRSELRNTGKGGAMVTGIKQALADGHNRIIFLDADIISMTSKWCDVLVEGIDRYNVAMTRGYFDRSPFDAQIDLRCGQTERQDVAAPGKALRPQFPAPDELFRQAQEHAPSPIGHESGGTGSTGDPLLKDASLTQRPPPPEADPVPSAASCWLAHPTS